MVLWKLTAINATLLGLLYDRFKVLPKRIFLPEIRYVPAEKFPFKGEITIYGTNKITVINLNKEYLTGIILEDETIHNMMRLVFELSWSSSLVKK